MKNCNFWVDAEHGRYIISVDGKETILADPKNHKHTIEDIKDIAVISDVPCYVYQNEEGKYSLRPALDGSGMAIDAYCYDIDSWGAYGDFEKIVCRCGYSWYMNVRKIPMGDKYEAVCPKCGMDLIIKNV